MMPTLIGIILVAHGLVHCGLAAAPTPNSKPGAFFTDTSRSWLLRLWLLRAFGTDSPNDARLIEASPFQCVTGNVASNRDHEKEGE